MRHSFTYKATFHSGHPGDVSTNLEWCSECGALRKTWDWSDKEEILVPKNGSSCEEKKT